MVTFAGFARAWRYAVETGFKNSNGQDFPYANDGRRAWGDEETTIKLDSSPHRAAINADRTLFAVSIGRDIHLYNADFVLISILRGHTSRVDVLAFQPRQPGILVSYAEGDGEYEGRSQPVILFWDLKDSDRQGRMMQDSEIKDVSDAAAKIARDSLVMLEPTLDHSATIQQSLAKAFELPIAQAIARSNAEKCRSVNGSLVASPFQPSIFSPSGRYMIYMPGESPESNSGEQWDVRIRSLEEREDILTLSGHGDIISSFDRTFRIWDARTGYEKYKFQTSGQNWTAGFSPDGKFFAGTSGEGPVHVYSLADGSEVFQLKGDERRCRAVDWAPDSKILAVVGRLRGKMVIVDVTKQDIIQKRVLSTAKSKEEDRLSLLHMDHYLSVSAIKFVDKGRKLVFYTLGDGSAEVYDLAAGLKWRFARKGTESEEGDGRSEWETRRVGSRCMEVWEDHVKGLVMVATLDYDAVRIWPVKMDP